MMVYTLAQLFIALVGTSRDSVNQNNGKEWGSLKELV